jgi:hypothetical protein
MFIMKIVGANILRLILLLTGNKAAVAQQAEGEAS